jgi:serine/threonine-protein kinase
MLVPGALIDGKYRIVRLLGEGGMGAVYEGQNLRIERRVAIKVMHPSIARDRALVGRFEREAQAAAKIGSAHIADVLDLGDLPRGERYLVMELLEGENLHSRIARRKFLAPVDTAHIAVQLLEGLAKVHDAGIIHRDLKPPNVFLAKQGARGDFVKILDFGICKMLTRASLSDGASAGHLLGTLPYMSPEQLASRGVDARADIFSVGVILYRCVTGQVPFRGANLVEHARLLKEGKPADVRALAPGVDGAFAEIVHRAIHVNRDERFPDARELQSALVSWSNRAQHIEHLLSDFLGTKLASEPPPRPSQVPGPPKATFIEPAPVSVKGMTLDAVLSAATPTPTIQESESPEACAPTVAPAHHPRTRERTHPMQSAPTIPGMRRPTIPQMPGTSGPGKQDKPTRRK